MIPPWSWADTARLIPIDRRAEESLTGQAIVSGPDARELLTKLSSVDFADTRCWDVISAASMIPGEVTDGDDEWNDALNDGDFMLVVHGAARRVNIINRSTGIETSWLRQLVTGRSAAPIGTFVDRLIEVGTARRRIARLLDQLDDLSVDVALLAEADARRVNRRHAFTAAAEAFGHHLYGSGTDADVVLALIELGLLLGVDGDQTSAAITAAAQTSTETPWT